MKKQPKKRPVKPKPCECWCLIERANGSVVTSWLTSDRLKPEIPNNLKRAYYMGRVRIVPVAPKKRSKRGGGK